MGNKNVQGVMIRVCMDCDNFLGTKPCEPEHNGKVTHGLCTECGEIRQRDLIVEHYPEVIKQVEMYKSKFMAAEEHVRKLKRTIAGLRGYITRLNDN